MRPPPAGAAAARAFADSKPAIWTSPEDVYRHIPQHIDTIFQPLFAAVNQTCLSGTIFAQGAYRAVCRIILLIHDTVPSNTRAVRLTRLQVRLSWSLAVAS